MITPRFCVMTLDFIFRCEKSITKTLEKLTLTAKQGWIRKPSHCAVTFD